MQTFRVFAVLFIAGLGILAYALWGHAGAGTSALPHETTHSMPVSQLTEGTSVKDIKLEYHQPDLPPGPGRDQFAAQCLVCHSPRYVLDQPVFPRKVWTAEVQKMVKAYGAMITPDEQKEIVDYLVYWHGKEDASTLSAPKSR